MLKCERIQPAVAGFEDGGRGDKEWGWPLEAGKGSRTHSSLQPRDGTQPCFYFNLV